MTLKFNGWPQKIIGQIFYTISSFVHHFKSISEFILELQSGNAQFGWKSTICIPVTLIFDVWPWKTIGHLFYATSSFVHHFVAIGEFKLELQSGNTQFGSNSTIFGAVWPWNLTHDLEKQQGISSMLLQVCALFCSHWWIQAGVTLQKHLLWIKIDIFFAMWPCNLTDDLEKQ